MDNIQCLLFPRTLKGMATDWFYTVSPRSITSFKRLKGKFMERLAGSIRIKKDLMEPSNIKQHDKETLCQWYELFTKVVEDIEDITLVRS